MARPARKHQFLTKLAGEYSVTTHAASILPKALISKGEGFCEPSARFIPTIVCKEQPIEIHKTGENARQRGGARERRAEQATQSRQHRQQEHFTDATAFAYFKGWPLEMRITITWGGCIYGDQNEGHILGLADSARNERLRSELARLLRNGMYTFACIWSRDEGLKLGLHTHLGLYWPLPENKLVQLLARLTGSPQSPDRLKRDVVAQSECGGWQIKRNMARNEFRSAMTWATYLRDQSQQHLIVPRIPGKVLGVSRSLGLGAVEAEKEALEAWKNRVGWSELEAAERA